jgi:hypothetical protein
MSKYLDRLKRLDDEEFSQHTPVSELTKPPEAPFVSFGGTSTGHIVKNSSESDTAHFMWQVILPKGELSVTNSPEATLTEMREWYPAALRIEPLIYQAGNDISDF